VSRVLDDGLTPTSVHAVHFRRPSERATWITVITITGAAITIVVGVLQAGHRGPLVWDEAARILAAQGLANALHHHSINSVFTWANNQTYYPFLSSLPSGLVLWAGGSALTAAWLPVLVAFLVSGLLVAWLARTMGLAWPTALLAAVLLWTAPLSSRLAAGQFTEPLGAVAELVVIGGLVRMARRCSISTAIAIAIATSIAAAIKYDYGILCVATIGVAELLRILRQRTRRSLVFGVITITSTAAFTGVQFAANGGGKLQGASDFVLINSPNEIGAYAHVFGGAAWRSLSYYPHALFTDHEVGLSVLVASAMVIGALFFVAQSRSNPAFVPPVVFLTLWFAMYSLAGFKWARILATAMPTLCLMAAVAIATATRWMWRSRVAVVPVTVGALVAAASFVSQGRSMTKQFWFLTPDPPASNIISFVERSLRPSPTPLLLVSPSNQFSPALLLLTSRRMAASNGYIVTIPEATTGQSLAVFRRAMITYNPEQLVVVSVLPGSPFDNAARFASTPSQGDYALLARELVNRSWFQEQSQDDRGVHVEVLHETAAGKRALSSPDAFRVLPT
jgi:hypothetical protein